jgi:hypothetical protein
MSGSLVVCAKWSIRKYGCVRELDEELLVVARDLGPPWVYVGAKGEGYEVVEVRVQRWVGRGGLEKG